MALSCDYNSKLFTSILETILAAYFPTLLSVSVSQ